MIVALKSARRRLPRATPPSGLEREYAASLLKYVDVVEFAMRPLMSQLPNILKDGAIRVDDQWHLLIPPRHSKTIATATRLDASPADVGKLITKAREVITLALTPGRLGVTIDDVAKKVAKHGRAQLRKQLESGLKISAFSANSLVKEDGVEMKLAAFAAENAALITGMSMDVTTQISKIATAALNSGASAKSVAREIEDRFGVARSRAKFIAVDQIGKLNGQLSVMRQKSLGCTHFYWQDSDDERVRKSHRARNGKRYPYSKPPEGNYPGEEPGCRCTPEADLDTIGDAS